MMRLDREFPRWSDLAIGLSLGVLVFIHYSSKLQFLWIHVLLFWFLQVPVLGASITWGLKGGLIAAGMATVALLPHMVGLSRHHGMTANAIWTDVAGIGILAASTGWLRDRWRAKQEQCERSRDLKHLNGLIAVLREDLREHVPAMRGMVDSLADARNRSAVGHSALHSLEQHVSFFEGLLGGFEILQVDSRQGFVRLDRVLQTARSLLRRIACPAPILEIDWHCTPPVIPGSFGTMSRALAILAFHVAPGRPGVQITITRRAGQVTVHLQGRGDAWDEGEVAPGPPGLTVEMARQMIQAHGGRVETDRSDGNSPRVSIHLPTALYIRQAGSRSVAPGDPDEGGTSGRRRPVTSPDSVRPGGGGTASGRSYDGSGSWLPTFWETR